MIAVGVSGVHPYTLRVIDQHQSQKVKSIMFVDLNTFSDE